MSKLLTHYGLIALKNIWKYRVSAAISILGLAFALICLVPILYWMDHELNYDSAYPDAESIYRIYSVEKSTGKTNTGASMAIQTSVCQENPAIEASTLLFITPENCRTDQIPYVQINMLYTDSTFLNVFPQEIICGNPMPLQAINNIVLTESMATRLFGEPAEAIGKHLQTLMAPKWAPYVVTAVVKDPNKHTNLPFDAIINHDMIQGLNRGPAEMQWQYFMTDLYVRLHPDTDPTAFVEKIRDIPERVGVNKELELRAMPIRDIRHHLKGDAPFTLDFIGLFVASGVLLLLAALFNFLNSYMDLFRQRAREWRLRLVNGATRRQLITQVAVELVCAVVAALLVTLIFIVQMKPLFIDWLDIDMDYARILIFFAEMGYRMGMDTFVEYLSAFGLGSPTGIEIGDAAGTLPENPPGQNLAPWAAYGQANQEYTPLQLANYVATLVSGGKHCEAHLLKAVKSYDNSQVLATGNTEALNTVKMADSTLEAVKEGMLGYTQPGGQLYTYFTQCVVTAGAKTGTAQLGGDQTNNGVFVCFAPYDDPEIVVSIAIEHGSAGANLASTAVEILNAYFTADEVGTAVIGEHQLLE